MIKINPAFVIKLLESLQGLLERAANTPSPEKVDSYITTPQENRTPYYVVVLKAAFKSENDAQAFLEFNDKLDEVLSNMQ